MKTLHWKTEFDAAHARAFSVAASFPAERLAAMMLKVRALMKARAPLAVVKAELFHRSAA